ncbi:beta-lactamase superfamily domain-containing protein [Cytidiella melzeri]|nr:beta-lactamase superfamily domain-containing protein [Cytidiella melzeri]
MDIPDSPPPAHHANDSATAFQNPWEVQSLLASKQVLYQFPLALAKRVEEERHRMKQVKVVQPDFGRDTNDEGVIKATWVGHAGFLVQMPKLGSLEPVRILFDPMWSDRASFNQYTGPKRRLQPPCKLEDLPDFQFVVTSHNHYDHLDWPTIDKIYKMKGENVTFLAPLGHEAWFRSCGIPSDQIIELDWHDSIDLRIDERHAPMKFVCTPAQHGSGRHLFDQRASLWSSWVVKQENDGTVASVYHAGDTGYMTQTGPCPAFAEIGERYGPFDLAMIPIWRGGSLAWISSLGLRLASTELLDGLHASPQHAIALHKDIRSRHSLGMHFATFAGSDAEALEPVAELIAEKEKIDTDVGDWMDEGGFGVIDVGHTAVVPVSSGDSGGVKEVKEK